MQETTFQIEDLQAKSVTKLNKDIGCSSLTLDITFKTSCNNCRCRGLSSCNCGYNYNSNSNKKDLEIKATIVNKCNLKADLEKALFSEDLSDFEFIIENEKIHVSKFILSARSPVFNRLFNSEFKEKQQNQQVLKTTFSKSAFKELIRYIYIGEVRDLSKHAFELLQASDYYQVESLKIICEEELLKILVESNANKIFQCAHLFRCSEALKQAAFNLIKKIFGAKNYNIPAALLNNPSKVSKLFDIKYSLENELSQPSTPENEKVLSNFEILTAPRSRKFRFSSNT
ncbi:hypothetical protein ACKWTF_005288 [Chironomus riparius]